MERRGGRAGVQLPGWGGAGKPQPQPCGGPLRAHGPAGLRHPLRPPARAWLEQEQGRISLERCCFSGSQKLPGGGA